MNREIKFRGKRIDNGEWIFGAYFCLHHNDERQHIHCFIIPDNTPIPKDKPIGEIQVEVIPATVGQYIGLKDKNGAESYHKDIVRTNAGYVGVMEFGSYSPTGNDRDNSWGWYIQCLDGEQIAMDEHFYYWGKILGNVIDNPELLED